MIYVCIPAHNEAQTVGVLLWKLRTVMAGFPRDYQVLVLDDGSTDDTAEVVKPYTSVMPLVLLGQTERRGYGAGLERLLREAVRRSEQPRRDVVVTLQADFSDAPEEVPTLVKRIEGGADLVGSTRDHDPATPRGLQWIRRAQPLLLRRASVPAGAGDPLSGFRAYRASALARAISARGEAALLSRAGLAANLELLLAVAPHARRLDCAGIAVAPRARQRPSRVRPWGVLTDLWALRGGMRPST